MLSTAIDRLTPATGAGIWVNVGRTWAVATKPELYLPWSEGNLVGRWLSKFGLPQRRLVEDRDFELSVSICRAHAAAEALKTARGAALKTDRCEAEWLLRRRRPNASAAARRPTPSVSSPSISSPSISSPSVSALRPLPSGPPLAALPSGPCMMAGHQWTSVAGHQRSSVLSSGPMIGVVGSSQSPQHAWNPLRYRLVPDAMCRLHDTCRCTLAAAAAASDPSALPRRARDGAQHDAAALGGSLGGRSSAQHDALGGSLGGRSSAQHDAIGGSLGGRSLAIPRYSHLWHTNLASTASRLGRSQAGRTEATPL